MFRCYFNAKSVQAMVIVKYMFQFGFFPWNALAIKPDDPFWAPRILGIEKKAKWAGWDLALLMVLFFHRSILKVCCVFSSWKALVGRLRFSLLS